MDPALTQEQDEIARALRDVLAKQAGTEEVRLAAASAAGYDAELWRRLAEQPGLAGLALPERHGGAGLGPVELALACEEAGRVLLPSPLLASSVLAAEAITACGTEEQRDTLLPPLASGARTAALVLPGSPALALGLVPDPNPRPNPLPGDVPAGGGRAGGIQAKPVADGLWTLYGEAAYVLDGARADLLVVAAHAGGFPRSRTVLFLVDASDADGLRRERTAGIDQTRNVGRVELRDVTARPLGDPSQDAAPALARVGRLAAVAVAAEAVGAAVQALARTVEYVQVRQQFGRAIGSFQAVKHRLADVYVAVETARSAMLFAAWSASATPEAAAPGTATTETAVLTTVTPAKVTPATVTPAKVTPATVTPATVPPATVAPASTTPGTVAPASTTPGTVAPASTTRGTVRPEAAKPEAATPAPTRPNDGVPALLALAAALTAQRTAAAEAIQLHGGIAITWEHDAHLYFKRAAADELLFGPPHLLRARAAELSGVLAATGTDTRRGGTAR